MCRTARNTILMLIWFGIVYVTTSAAQAQKVIITPGNQVMRYDADESITLYSAADITESATLNKIFQSRVSQYRLIYAHYEVKANHRAILITVPQGKELVAYFDLDAGVSSVRVCIEGGSNGRFPTQMVIVGQC